MSPATDAPRPRVLVADDEDDIRTLLQRALSRDYDVLVASDGREAEGIVEREELDAVISDHRMPGLTGVDLLSATLSLQPHCARILFTATDDLGDVADAVNRAHVHRFFTKPIRLVELRSGLEGAIKQVSLEKENRRLLQELERQNGALESALDQIRGAERRLEQQVRERTQQLRQTNAELERLALKDPLTNLFNRRYLEEALEREVARAIRYEKPVSVLFLDVDNFKSFNDTHGHPAGDALLTTFGDLLMGGGEDYSGRRRKSDIVARYGGEEFVLVLPQTSRDGARTLAERIRGAVDSHPFENQETQPGGSLTCSVGFATFPGDATNAATLLDAADRGLLEAKRSGRNRVCPPPDAQGEGTGD